MPAITLPDGSVRRFDGPVTGTDSGGRDRPRPRPRRARDEAGRKAGRSRHADRRRRERGFRHPQGRGCARADPPRCGARARRGGAGAVSRHPGHDRPGDRERVLLRFRPQRAVHAGGLSRDRGEDARDRGARRTVPARGDRPRGGDPLLPGHAARNTRRSSSRICRRTKPSRCTGRASGSISAAARICARRAMSATPSS